jgi:UDP-3-O-acyl-N-acetylglucosamine deacetylase
VVGKDGLLNDAGLRWPDELVRHKIVDLLGDLALLEAELHARITVEKGGHGLHLALVKALVKALAKAHVESLVDAQGPARVGDLASARSERMGLVVERAPRGRGERRRAGSQPG